MRSCIFPTPARLVILVFLILSICSEPVSAELSFNKLTVCSDIGSLTEEIRKGSMPAPNECRPASGPIEKSIVYRMGGASSDICVLAAPPRQVVAGFSCVRSPVQSGGTIACFRPVDRQDIVQYKNGYKVQGAMADRVHAYLVEASKCKASNGNVTVAPLTTLSPVIATVARMEFGFAMRIGVGRMPDSYVLHGYATTDPEIRGSVEAIEFISIVAGGRIGSGSSQSVRMVKSGGWLIAISDKVQLGELQKRQLSSPGVSADGWIRTYAIERQETAQAPAIDRDALLAKVQGALASKLVGPDKFKELTDEQLRQSTGLSAEQIAEQRAAAVPFGFRHLSSERFYGRVRMFYQEQRPACAANGSGAIGVGFVSTRGIPDVEPDYGSTDVFVFGMGSCANTSRPSTHEFLSDVDDLIEDTIASEIAKW